MVNVTNSSVATQGVVPSLTSLAPLVFERFVQLVSAPFRHQEMLWIIFPLLLTFVVLEFYFDRHGDEELGWAAAVANSLILFIVALDLLRHSFPGISPLGVAKMILLAVLTGTTLPLEPQVLVLILFLALAGLVVTVVNYYHLLPRRLAFEVSGHPPVNFLAYFSIAIVYTAGTPDEIPLEVATLLAGLLVYLVLLLGVFSFKRMVRRLIHGKRRFRG